MGCEWRRVGGKGWIEMRESVSCVMMEWRILNMYFYSVTYMRI